MVKVLRVRENGVLVPEVRVTGRTMKFAFNGNTPLSDGECDMLMTEFDIRQKNGVWMIQQVEDNSVIEVELSA